jgi:general secretion pathway protein J
MLYSIRARCNLGFTLLELLVVVLLVSLLASLLMQGFIYLSGVYSVVERRQSYAKQKELLDGWVRDSIQSLINGIDSDRVFTSFVGDSESFSGISVQSISQAVSGSPVRIKLILQKSSQTTTLIYEEAPLLDGSPVQYVLHEWPSVDAQWRYWDGVNWLSSFPSRTRIFNSEDNVQLPLAISLYVDTAPVPIELIVATRSSVIKYYPPVGEDY